MSRPTSIIVTSIFEPAFLQGYLENIKQYGHEVETTLYVIADRKTPTSLYEACAEAKSQGFQVECPSLDDQTEYLNSLGLPENFIPWNTDNRRNIGYLMAIEHGCEVLISIDDDNFIIPGEDFIGSHHIVGTEFTENVTDSNDGWFNICDLLESSSGPNIFARGFPYFAQQRERDLQQHKLSVTAPIAMNAGLWLDAPDVDAVFRLSQRPKIMSAKPNASILSSSTWSPINTQNTALTREAALTYYYVKMGFPLQGLKIDRFGDILSGYLTQKCIKHLGQLVRLGSPVLDHRRSVHNLFKDLYHELAGIVLIEDLIPWIQEVQLTGSKPLEAYESLAQQMLSQADQFQGFIWDEGGREFLKQTAEHMLIWKQCVSRFA